MFPSSELLRSNEELGLGTSAFVISSWRKFDNGGLKILGRRRGGERVRDLTARFLRKFITPTINRTLC